MKDNIYSELDQDERITCFIKGKMNVKDEMKFLADMKSDEQLKQDAIAQARLIRGMAQVDDELIQTLKNASKAEVISSVHSRKVIFRKTIGWISMAASIALFIFIGYYGYDYYDTTHLGMRYATAFPMETSVRGDSNSTVESELQTLFNNIIERKNLSETTERLSELWTISNQEVYNDYTDYAPYIGWYLAIGYLEDYEKDKAKSILQIMYKDSDINIRLKTQISKLLEDIE